MLRVTHILERQPLGERAHLLDVGCGLAGKASRWRRSFPPGRRRASRRARAGCGWGRGDLGADGARARPGMMHAARLLAAHLRHSRPDLVHTLL